MASQTLKRQSKLNSSIRETSSIESHNGYTNIVDNLVREIAGLEEEARQCYSVPVQFSSDDFVKILIVDGCFLIELFHKETGSIWSPHDVISSRPFLSELVSNDILVLENQIPWAVLDRLFRLTTIPGPSSLIILALRYLSAIQVGVKYPDEMVETNLCLMQSTFGRSKHILDLLRNALVGTSTVPNESYLDDEWELIPSASSLMEAGVKFKKGNSSNGMLDIIFDGVNGVLEIPPFVIHEGTEAVFRNLISFEQCHNSCGPRITNYAMLLDQLINDPKDINILCEKEIIKNWLNPAEAAEIFNTLYNDANVSKLYYDGLCQQVNKYCKRGWPKWRAMYVRNNFSSPWAIASQVLAAILFILTLLQTVFGIKSSI